MALFARRLLEDHGPKVWQDDYQRVYKRPGWRERSPGCVYSRSRMSPTLSNMSCYLNKQRVKRYTRKTLLKSSEEAKYITVQCFCFI